MYSDSTALSREPNTQWIRTDAIHDARQLTTFQDEFTQVLAGVHVEPLHGHSLALACSVTVFDGVAIHIATTSPTRCIHPRASGPDDGVMLMGMPQGQWQVQARGRVWDVADGDVVFARPNQPEAVVAHTPAHMCAVLLSRSLLGSMGIDVDAALLRPLRGNPAAALLMQYTHLVRDHNALASPVLRRAATLHLHDLAALLAGAVGDAAHQAHGRGVRAARLLAVKNDIAAHFTDPLLSVAAVARRQGITPRYLQMLLEQDGLTFTALVLEQRLALARRLLQDPRLAARTVSTIAFDVGFGDLSYFNRSFRQRYGMTPTDARACALGALLPYQKA